MYCAIAIGTTGSKHGNGKGPVVPDDLGVELRDKTGSITAWSRYVHELSGHLPSPILVEEGFYGC